MQTKKQDKKSSTPFKSKSGTTASNINAKSPGSTNDRSRNQDTWNKNEVANKEKLYAKGNVDPSKDKKGINQSSNREDTDDEESIE